MTIGRPIYDVDMIDEGCTAIEAIEQLLCASGTTDDDLESVYASPLAELLRVVRNHICYGIRGQTLAEWDHAIAANRVKNVAKARG